MTSSILTIDQATRSGFCNWIPGLMPVLSALDLKYINQDPGKRLSVFEDHLLANIRKNKVDCICFETPLLMRSDKPEQLRGIYGWANMIEKVAYDEDIPCYEVAVSTWRTIFLGSGKYSTDEAKSRCMIKCEQMKLAYEDHDECEAMGIMDYLATKFSLKKDWPEPGLLRFTQ